MNVNLLKTTTLFLLISMIIACQPKYGYIPSDAILQGLKGYPKAITEKSYANDSLFALSEPEENARMLFFNKKGEIISTKVYSADCLSFFSEKQKNHGDTLITNSYLPDSVQISVIKQWKTSDSTYELHEFFMEEGQIVGEISSIKTQLNVNQQPEKEEMITETGYHIVTENVYSEKLLISQQQGMGADMSIFINYRYLKFDHHQNWTLRQCVFNDGFHEEMVSYQVRTIEYY